MAHWSEAETGEKSFKEVTAMRWDRPRERRLVQPMVKTSLQVHFFNYTCFKETQMLWCRGKES